VDDVGLAPADSHGRVLKAWVSSHEPVSSWSSLALSCAGVLFSVLAPIFLWVGINQPSFRTGLLIGLGGLALAPWFSIAGWMFGNSRIRLISPDTAGRNAGGRARTDSAPLAVQSHGCVPGRRKAIGNLTDRR
jgi:hypothetical protein